VVVVVSDDEGSRREVRDYFRSIGCHSFDAANGFDALQVVKEHRSRLLVLLVDSDLPNLARPEFANAAKAILPSVCIGVTPMAGRIPAAVDVDEPFARTRFATLYDAVVRALSGMPQ
jgi:two-component system response regulator (stage 0 sporulation protein F)